MRRWNRISSAVRKPALHRFSDERVPATYSKGLQDRLRVICDRCYGQTQLAGDVYVAFSLGRSDAMMRSTAFRNDGEQTT